MTPKQSIELITEILSSKSDEWEKVNRIILITELTEIDRKESKVTLEKIRKQIEKHSGIPFEEICRKTNEHNRVVLRQLAMYKARRFTNYSLASIGSFFGNKDHATVLHANKTIQDMLDTDRRFRIEHEAFLIS